MKYLGAILAIILVYLVCVLLTWQIKPYEWIISIKMYFGIFAPIMALIGYSVFQQTQRLNNPKK